MLHTNRFDKYCVFNVNQCGRLFQDYHFGEIKVYTSRVVKNDDHGIYYTLNLNTSKVYDTGEFDDINALIDILSAYEHDYLNIGVDELNEKVWDM